MKELKFSLLTLILICISCGNPDSIVAKPELFKFGISMEELSDQLKLQCNSIIIRLDEPIQLPTAKISQSQLDCYGFEYAGKKRKVELIFADNSLDMLWILTEAEEEFFFVEEFSKLYGQPTHIKNDATFFLANGVAVRNEPHEVLFISERLKAAYEQFLNQ